jgi:cold shock CspA family protein
MKSAKIPSRLFSRFIGSYHRPLISIFKTTVTNMADTWNKKEREKKKQQNKKEKEERKQERKEKSKGGNDLDSMLAYIDENGNITSTPPDPRKRTEVNVEDIVIGVPKHVDMGEDDPIRTGTVTYFNDSKGYGFIKDTASGESVFVHVKSLTVPIKEMDKVSFEVAKGPKGFTAVDVKLVK